MQVILDGSTTTRSNNSDAYTTLQLGQHPRRLVEPDVHVHAREVRHDRPQAGVDHDRERRVVRPRGQPRVPRHRQRARRRHRGGGDLQRRLRRCRRSSRRATSVVANSNARPDLVGLINSATKSLDVEDEEFSDNDSSGITDAVVSAAGRGVTVRLIVAGGSTDATQTTALDDVKSGRRRRSTCPTCRAAAAPRRTRTSTRRPSSSTARPAPARAGSSGSENMTTGSLAVQPRARGHHQRRDAARRRLHRGADATSPTRRTRSSDAVRTPRAPSSR